MFPGGNRLKHMILLHLFESDAPFLAIHLDGVAWLFLFEFGIIIRFRGLCRLRGFGFRLLLWLRAFYLRVASGVRLIGGLVLAQHSTKTPRSLVHAYRTIIGSRRVGRYFVSHVCIHLKE